MWYRLTTSGLTTIQIRTKALPRSCLEVTMAAKQGLRRRVVMAWMVLVVVMAKVGLEMEAEATAMEQEMMMVTTERAQMARSRTLCSSQAINSLMSRFVKSCKRTRTPQNSCLA